MKTRRFGLLAQVTAWTITATMGLLPSTYAAAQARHAALRRAFFTPKPQLPDGWTQLLTPEQWKQVDAQRAKQSKGKQPAVRVLSKKEMRGLNGRGQARFAGFSGTLPWQRSFRDVNLCNGNLFKSFTDVQVAPAKGAGLALQRTYNSSDDREGAFGVGWTHAYDIRLTEAPAASSSNEPDKAVRSDFFDGKHGYSRDADGLYTPPPYLFDELDSQYTSYLTHPFPTSDDQLTQDGTKKHFEEGYVNTDGSAGERVCLSITDRYGNATTLTYDTYTDNGKSRKFLKEVQDPSGRKLYFRWYDLNQGAGGVTKWRIVQVDSPAYSVVYDYDTTGANAFNLKSVTVDASSASSYVSTGVAGSAPHEARKTSFAYAPCYYQNNLGQTQSEPYLLTKITDPLGHSTTTGLPDASLGHAVSYTYEIKPCTNTVWVSTVVEPAAPLSTSPTTVRTLTWTIQPDQNISANPSSISCYPNGMGSSPYRLYYRIDSNFRWTTATLYIDTGSYDMYKTVYDGKNQVTESWTRQALGSANAGAWRIDNYTYNTQGSVVSHWLDGHQSKAETTSYYNASQYFEKRKVTDSLNRTTLFYVGDRSGYDNYHNSTAAGNVGSVMAVEDPEGNTYEYTYYAALQNRGQKASETNPKGSVTQFHYGSLSTSGSYPAITDDWNNLTEVVQDAGGLNRRTRMKYDEAGRVLNSYDPKAQTTTFTYNNLGQPKSAAFPAAYDVQNTTTQVAPAQTIYYTYGGNGRMDSVQETCPADSTLNRGTTTLTYYDGCDFVKTASDPTSGTLSYEYGKMNERRKVSLPGGGYWAYVYDDQSPDPYTAYSGMLPKDDPNSLMPRLVATQDDGNGSNGSGTVREVQYDLYWNGQMRSMKSNRTLGYNNAEMQYLQTVQTYDSDGTAPNSMGTRTHGWLTSTVTTFNSRTQANQAFTVTGISSNTYDYGKDSSQNSDETGLRAKNTVSLLTPAAGQATYLNRNETYSYDDLNRLSEVYYNNDNTGQHQTYTFDECGNRTDKGDNVTGNEVYTVNNANMLLTRKVGNNAAVSYTNDSNGNVWNDGIRSNQWDSQSRLIKSVTSTSTSEFLYGADGLRKTDQSDAEQHDGAERRSGQRDDGAGVGRQRHECGNQRCHVLSRDEWACLQAG